MVFDAAFGRRWRLGLRCFGRLPRLFPGFGQTALGRSFWLVVMLGLAEWSRGFVGTGFPWNMPGSLFAVDVASLQAASLFGAYGLTMLALLLAMVPAFWAVGGRRFAVIWLLVPFGLVDAGIWRLEHAAAGSADSG